MMSNTPQPNNKRQTSDKWMAELHPDEEVLDTDGWDRRNFTYSFYDEEITEQEFNKRFMMSTVSFKPFKVEPNNLNASDDWLLDILNQVGFRGYVAGGGKDTDNGKNLYQQSEISIERAAKLITTHYEQRMREEVRKAKRSGMAFVHATVLELTDDKKLLDKLDKVVQSELKSAGAKTHSQESKVKKIDR